MKSQCIFDTEIRANGSSIIGTIFYDSLSENLGGFRERLLPGCFSASLQSDDVKALWQHDHSKPLASTAAGTMTFIDGKKCLTITMALDPTITHHRDALESVRRKDATGLSFSFKVKKPGGERWTTDAAGEKIRELSALTCREFSVVTFPAYPKSSAAVRKQNNSTFTNRRTTQMTLNEKRMELGRNNKRLQELDSKEHLDAIEEAELRKLEEACPMLEEEIKREARRQDIERRAAWLSSSQREPIKPQPGAAERREEPKNSEEQRDMGYFARALSMDGGSGDQAGYLVSETLQGGLITKAKDLMALLSLCEIMRVKKSAGLILPTLETEPANPTFTQELSIGASDSQMDFQARSLSPHPLSSYVKISKKLVEASDTDVTAVVMDWLGYKHATVMENAILNGTGANQPLGCMVNSVHGIGTDRDVSTGNVATAIKCDGLIEAMYSLKSGYIASKRAAWVFSRPAMKSIRALKTGDGAYIYEPSLTAGTPAMLLGIPVIVSEYMPSTFTSGSYVGILGDWKYYAVCYAMEAKFEILKELFALTNQIAVTCRTEVDSMPTVSEAFARVKLP